MALRVAGGARIGAVAVFCTTCLWTAACRTAASKEDAPQGQAAEKQGARGVGALGRVQPGDGVVRIGARSLGGQPSIVGRVLVREGDMVRAGQVVAELDSKAQLDAAARQAEARIEVARSHLAQVQAGAKPSDIAAQQSEVDRLQSELENARKEYQRYASLGDNVTTSQVDTVRLRVDATTRAMAAAQQRLSSLTEVRPVDVDVARSELNEAVRNHERARAELEASVLRSPIDGRVIKIHTWPSEQVAAEGVLEVAPVEPMYVVAEVDESDIRRVRTGQRATISADALQSPLDGTVERIGLAVLRNTLLSTDPASFSDGRVVNVWIKMNDSRAVAELIDLQVDVLLQP